MTVLRRAVSAFLVLKLGVLVGNLAAFPVLGRGRPARLRSAGTPDVISLLVPVRNEAGRLRRTLPSLLAQQASEILVLDDQSDDDSRAELVVMLAGHPRARLVDGTPAPTGWVGKNWACHQLAGAATGSVLVFCDSDTALAGGALPVLLAEMHRQRADVFSVFPRQITGSLGEHLIVPLLDDAVLCLLPFGLLSVDVPQAATANGSLLAFRRAAYDTVGGFAAVRSELVEDVALARRTRGAGLKLGLALGGDLVQTRMYDGYSATVRGLGRGLVPVAAGSRALLIAGLLWHVVAYTLPWVLGIRRRSWLLLGVLGIAERLLVEVKTARGQAWQALLAPLSPLAVAPVVAQSLRRRQTWKGRTSA